MRRSFSKIYYVNTIMKHARTYVDQFAKFKLFRFAIRYLDRTYVPPFRRKVINTEFDCKWKEKNNEEVINRMVHFNFGQYLDTVRY